MNIILMSTVLNANGISGKAANKVHFYLYFNDTSEFVLISPVFHKWFNKRQNSVFLLSKITNVL